ncbi:MAG: putative aminoglycoside phosphotransferase, partial [Solirubrobacterales bacterium]|nr:putative aminoglycoside phosphotransferase [Solirubrobacterales bacterium]
MSPAVPIAMAPTELLSLSVEEVGRRIEALLAETIGQPVSVTGVRRTFGGNARRAWSFDAAWSSGGEDVAFEGIMLSQVERAQVDGDLADEHALLRGLQAARVEAPDAIALDVTGEVIGAPSVVLERRPGDANAVRFLRAEDPVAPTAAIRHLAALAARLHTYDWRAAGLGPVLGDEGLDPRAAARQQVEGWQASFLAARMEPQPVLTSVYRWLLDRLPEPERVCVVHGDFRLGNFLYVGDRITALLDWELAHLGDPVEDLAWAYRDFWSPARFVPLEDFVDAYAAAGGPRPRPAHLRYYRVFTEAKFATISLRAARAFHEGRTTNLRLADRAATV